MSKSKYYMPADAVAKSYQNETRIKEITYDKDVSVFENAIILPLRKCIDQSRSGLDTYEGGVCDSSFNFIAGYARTTDTHRVPAMEVLRSYETSVDLKFDEDVIYGGVIFNGFGHFLMDGFVRLWYEEKNKGNNLRFAFLKVGNFDLQEYHTKLLELAGIDEKRVLIVNQPSKFNNVIVPKQAWYPSGAYNRDLFRLPWDKIRSRVTPKKESKVYLSRSKFKNQDMFGEGFFENFFESRGFMVIYPEQLPIKEQIAYISGADELACTDGTLSHHAVFAKDGTKFTFLLRYSRPAGGGFQGCINDAKKLDFVYVDTALTIFPNFHSSYAGFIIGPTQYWNEYLEKEHGIQESTNIYEYLDNTNIKLGSYIKLYTEKTSTQRNFSLGYGYRFNYVNYLKQIYGGFAPKGYPRMQSAMKINSSPFFRDRIFRYKKNGSSELYTIKLLANGQVWPVSHNTLGGERYWSFLKDRLYFLNSDCLPIIEFVAEIEGRKHDDKAKYNGAALSKITETYSLETYRPGTLRNWVIKHAIKILVNKRKYKKLKQKPARFFRDSKSSLMRFLGRYYIRGNSTVIFYWRMRFQKYFDTHNIRLKVDNLKVGMDDISVTYIDNFMKLSRYWYKSTFVGSQRPEHELSKQKSYKEFKKTFNQPFPDVLSINPYFFFDIYGLADLPKEVLSSINGKVIIDGGGDEW